MCNFLILVNSSIYLLNSSYKIVNFSNICSSIHVCYYMNSHVTVHVIVAEVEVLIGDSSDKISMRIFVACEIILPDTLHPTQTPPILVN